MSAYKELKEIFYKNKLISDIDSILNWDLSTMMPKKTRKHRAKQLSFLNNLKHEIFNNKKIKNLFEKVVMNNLDIKDKANFLEMKKEYEYFKILPKELIEKKVILSASCEGKWRKAKILSNFNIVKDDLEKLTSFVKEESKILSDFYECSPYDALLKKYDTSYNSKEIKVFFDELLPFIMTVYEKVIEKQKKIKIFPIKKNLSEKQQFILSNHFMKKIGFDFNKGRIDLSAHPFCGGAVDDIRITTRINKNDSFSAFDAVIHETGHALYELGLPKKWKYQPAGKSGGMALHESQSLFWEMHITKSLEFRDYLSSTIRKLFSLKGKEWSGENLYNIANLVEKKFIRVESDEITYPLHIILRFNIERQIIDNKIKISELPDVWNNEFKKFFKFDVINDSDGCLQDIHWFTGDIGYFPTYSIGAMLAAQFKCKLDNENENIKDLIFKGKFKFLKKWLHKNIHNKASFFSTKQIVKQVTLSSLSAKFLKNHIKNKYL